MYFNILFALFEHGDLKQPSKIILEFLFSKHEIKKPKLVSLDASSLHPADESFV